MNMILLGGKMSEIITNVRDFILYLSHNSMVDWSKCRRYYYWKRIKKLEKVSLNIPFMVGRIVQHGIFKLFSDPKNAVKETLAMFKVEKKTIRKAYPSLSVDQEEELSKQEFVTKALVTAYGKQYTKFFRESTLIKNEMPLKYQLNKNTFVVAKIDDVIKNRGKNWLYELKTASSIDATKVKKIKTDAQTSLYHTLYGLLVSAKDKLSGILYSIVKKPGIRQKKTETKNQFLHRLENWYEDADDGDIRFHMERISSPLISADAILNRVDKIAAEMHRAEIIDDYYQDFDSCISEWKECDFYEICHNGGPTKENLLGFTTRKSYKVEAGK